MSRRHRLRGRGRVAAVRRGGVGCARGVLRVHAQRNGLTGARAALAVPGIRGAVERNRLRRRLREALRPHLGVLGGVDVVVVATPSAVGVTYSRLHGDLSACVACVIARLEATRPEQSGAADLATAPGRSAVAEVRGPSLASPEADNGVGSRDGVRRRVPPAPSLALI